MGPRLRGDDRNGMSSQNETHRTQRAELVGVDQHAAFLDAKTVAGLAQHEAVATDIFADALVAAEAVADEIGRDGYEIALDADDTHIDDHPPGAGFRKFGMTIGI